MRSRWHTVQTNEEKKTLIKEYLPLDVLNAFKKRGLQNDELKNEVENWFKENSEYGK